MQIRKASTGLSKRIEINKEYIRKLQLCFELEMSERALNAFTLCNAGQFGAGQIGQNNIRVTKSPINNLFLLLRRIE